MMDQNILERARIAYENRDLETLNELALPADREMNTRKDFKSVLMLSAHNFKHLTKIPELEADCIILNLEDGVSPREKPFALVLCAIFLGQLPKCDKKLVVRVNALDEGGFEEINYLNQFHPDAIRVPKVSNKDEVRSALALIKDGIELHLTIETAQAWHNLRELGINRHVTTFYLGVLDLFADMGLCQSLINRGNHTMFYILSHFLMSCKGMGVKPVSFVYQEYKNLEEFEAWLHLEKSMGYEAKGCISPDQAKLVNKILVDEQKELIRAQKIIKLFEQSQKEGVTGFVDEEYGFIDEPIYKGALAYLRSKEH